MENIIAMVAVVVAIFFAKYKYIPACVFAYYGAYFAVEFATFGQISGFNLIEPILFVDATIHYMIIGAIELAIIIALCCNMKGNTKVSYLYAIFVLTSLVYNSIQAISMTVDSNWFIDFYTVRQQIAIPVDILFAFVGGYSLKQSKS